MTDPLCQAPHRRALLRFLGVSALARLALEFAGPTPTTLKGERGRTYAFFPDCGREKCQHHRYALVDGVPKRLCLHLDYREVHDRPGHLCVHAAYWWGEFDSIVLRHGGTDDWFDPTRLPWLKDKVAPPIRSSTRLAQKRKAAWDALVDSWSEE